MNQQEHETKIYIYSYFIHYSIQKIFSLLNTDLPAELLPPFPSPQLSTLPWYTHEKRALHYRSHHYRKKRTAVQKFVYLIAHPSFYGWIAQYNNNRKLLSLTYLYFIKISSVKKMRELTILRVGFNDFLKKEEHFILSHGVVKHFKKIIVIATIRVSY